LFRAHRNKLLGLGERRPIVSAGIRDQSEPAALDLELAGRRGWRARHRLEWWNAPIDARHDA
jgi:hypothetical protein